MPILVEMNRVIVSREYVGNLLYYCDGLEIKIIVVIGLIWCIYMDPRLCRVISIQYLFWYVKSLGKLIDVSLADVKRRSTGGHKWAIYIFAIVYDIKFYNGSINFIIIVPIVYIFC